MPTMRQGFYLSSDAFAVDESEEHRLPIGAEDILHRPPDLVERAVAARAVEDVGHEVLRSARGGAQRIETTRHEIVVARATHALHARALLTVRLFTDAQQRNRQTTFLGHELV